MSNGEFCAKIEKLGALAVELRHLWEQVETTDDRWPEFVRLVDELSDYL